MTDEVDWDPLNLNLHPRSKEEEEMNRLVASRVDGCDYGSVDDRFD
jgi:hypothetical protein